MTLADAVWPALLQKGLDATRLGDAGLWIDLASNARLLAGNRLVCDE